MYSHEIDDSLQSSSFGIDCHRSLIELLATAFIASVVQQRLKSKKNIVA